MNITPQPLINIFSLNEALKNSSLEFDQMNPLIRFTRGFSDNDALSAKNILTFIKILNVSECDENINSITNLALKILALTFFNSCSNKLWEIAAPNLLNIKKIATDVFDLSFKNPGANPTREIDNNLLRNRVF